MTLLSKENIEATSDEVNVIMRVLGQLQDLPREECGALPDSLAIVPHGGGDRELAARARSDRLGAAVSELLAALGRCLAADFARCPVRQAIQTYFEPYHQSLVFNKFLSYM